MKKKSTSTDDASYSLDNIGNKYILITKLFFIISIFLLFIVIIIAMGISILKMGPNFAILSLEYWMYIWCAIVGFFIVLELIFYFLYNSKNSKITFEEVDKTEYLHGKKVHIYTYPPSVKGGIFSKTYIEIDTNNVLRLRSLMIPPRDLWKK